MYIDIYSCIPKFNYLCESSQSYEIKLILVCLCRICFYDIKRSTRSKIIKCIYEHKIFKFNKSVILTILKMITILNRFYVDLGMYKYIYIHIDIIHHFTYA